MLEGTITLGGTAQEFLPASSIRRGWWIQNKSAGDLFVSDGATASATVGVKISAGQLYETPDAWGSQFPQSISQVGGLITIFGATTGQAFVYGGW